MRKGTIFRYEFRRLIVSREYLLLTAAVLFYCAVLLRSVVMLGTAYTAPFSPWTFSAYLSSVMVLLLILLLMLCARQFTESERRAMAIIASAPMPARAFKAIRYGAVACAFLLASAVPAVACFGFYWLVFAYTAWGGLLAAGMMIILPSALVVFGTAMLLGSQKPVFVYALLAAVLVIGAFGIALPAGVDILGGSVTRTLSEGAGAFRFTPAFVAGRIAFTAVGILCIALSLKPARNRNAQA